MTTFMGRQPLYEQLANMLRYRIENEMDPDDPLPSERELSDSYGLSRTTVRLALQELEHGTHLSPAWPRYLCCRRL